MFVHKWNACTLLPMTDNTIMVEVIMIPII
jgi:hypothetical protein